MVLIDGRLRHLSLGLLVLAVLMMASGCSKKMIRSEGPGPGRPGPSAGRGTTGTDDGTQAIGPDGRLGEERLGAGSGSGTMDSGRDIMTTAATQARELFVSEDIFFAYNSAILSPDARTVLQDKADWLRANPQVNVEIEGHTDERGTVAYNLALGNQRAVNAKNFLIDLGIGAGRFRTVSYGEERPLDPGANEAAWSRNRRAHFEIR